MDRKTLLKAFGAGLFVALVALISVITMHSDGDDIEEGKVYALAYTYKSDIKGSNLQGRVFDFADRNLPRPSILVPVRDERGIELVREYTNMAPSTVRKMRVRIREKVIEGVKYPAYEYVEWQFRFATREVQDHVPTVIPRK